jgi:hypothetical protein
MILKTKAPPLGAAGPGNVVHALAAVDAPDLKGPNQKIQDLKRLRLKFLASRLHALGPKPLAHFLDEVERVVALRPTLEEYAALPADLIRAYRGDEFTPPFAIDGGEP